MCRVIKGTGLYYSKVKIKTHISFEHAIANGSYRNMRFFVVGEATGGIDAGGRKWYNNKDIWERRRYNYEQ